MSSIQFSKVDLFGGAIKCELPAGWLDVSNIRQVPDNQEVYMSNTTKPGEEECSIIIELLALQDDVPNEQIGLFQFIELAKEEDESLIQDAILQQVEINKQLTTAQDLPQLSAQGVYASYLQGHLWLSKTRSAVKTRVQIYMVDIRLFSVTTDLLITLNYPETASPLLPPQAILHRLLASLKIEDWSLFK
eukprot:TRINITY_DN1325_c0_g1_i1.p1 TRINITY_DN1325_c0_g1~~TRINITY_DN1325_c0_g1_i1.p1  ORF type:complete len:190 (-),score=32.51 TRINITY_DN1325_c0_g1_i1:31-600(-)